MDAQQNTSDQLRNEIIYYATKLCLNDEFWRAFGFRKRPKRGALFDCLVSKTRLNFETFLVRELIVIACVPYFFALHERKNGPFVGEFVCLLCDRLSSFPALAKSLRFEDTAECEEFFLTRWDEYIAKKGSDKWRCLAGVFLTQARACLDDTSFMKALVGMAQMESVFASAFQKTESRIDQYCLDVA